MTIIANELHVNAVRIEGEETSHLVVATEVAYRARPHVVFNPWKMRGSADEQFCT
ncbi:uncharacterized protein YabE (DUF348 family) [Mucilaginibacter sp. SG538B]|nr:uncharacterized protein YabE (DUF348 family) [Mucilaginibacter sp. SG538B]